MKKAPNLWWKFLRIFKNRLTWSDQPLYNATMFSLYQKDSLSLKFCGMYMSPTVLANTSSLSVFHRKLVTLNSIPLIYAGQYLRKHFQEGVQKAERVHYTWKLLETVVISGLISERFASVYKDCIVNMVSLELRCDYAYQKRKRKTLLQIIIFHQLIYKKQRRNVNQ